MPNKKTYKTKSKVKIVEEPLAIYGEKRIVFFNSFEKENKYTHQQRASMSPIENLKTVTTMVKRFFEKELKENPTLGKRIYFDK
jgi:bisphosphoglycerate-dependent phosphoglycerate mutase